jgi:hypothetical protein
MLNVQGLKGVEMSKRRKGAGAKVPVVGDTPEEIEAALVRGMRDLLAGRITVKEANRIAHAANMQLHRLKVMDWLERMAMRERGESKGRRVQMSKSYKSRIRRQDAGATKGGPRWMN